MKLDETVALVAGGAAGVGKTVAETILKQGGKVCLVDVAEDRLSDIAFKLHHIYGDSSVTFYSADVTIRPQFEAAFHHAKFYFGHINTVVNAAGILSETKWQHSVQVNLGGVINGTELACRFLRDDKPGLIVNVGSVVGIKPTSFPSLPVYAAAEAGAIAFTQSMAHCLERRSPNVRIVCLCPTLSARSQKNRRMASLIGEDELDGVPLRTDEPESPNQVASVFVGLVENSENNGVVAIMADGDKVEYKFILNE